MHAEMLEQHYEIVSRGSPREISKVGGTLAMFLRDHVGLDLDVSTASYKRLRTSSQGRSGVTKSLLASSAETTSRRPVFRRWTTYSALVSSGRS